MRKTRIRSESNLSTPRFNFPVSGVFGVTDKIAIMGMSGCGKSYLGKKIQELYPRRVIFDRLFEYDQGEIQAHSFEGFSQAMIHVFKNSPERFAVVYRFNLEHARLHPEEFNQALRVLYYQGGLQIVIEECQLYATPHNIPYWLEVCALTGRHRKVSLLLTTQRPGICNKTLLSQCQHFFIGRMWSPNDIEFLRSFIGDRAYELDAIPLREFLWFRPGHPIIRITNDFRVVS